MNDKQNDSNASLRRANALIEELQQRVETAEQEHKRLLSAIRNHRAQKGFNGKIGGDDHRLWEAAGLGDAGWADIKGDG